MHDLEILNGIASMFSAQNVCPWHKLGHIVDKVETAEEAIRLAGLDWGIDVEDAFTADGKRVEGCKIIRRDTDKAQLGVTGERFTPLLNRDAFSFFDAFIKAGEAEYTSAGSLCGGSRVWIQARIVGDPMMIGDVDAIERYIMLSNSHDGKSAVKLGYTGQRIVCKNTLTLAHNDRASKLIRVRHSAKVLPALEDVRLTMNSVKSEFEATADMFNRMADKGINKDDLRKYVCKVFDAPSDDPPRCLTPIMEAFENAPGADMAGSTAWGAYNAATFWLTHEQGRTDEKRLESNMYGQNLAVNEKALQYAYNYAINGSF